MSPTRLLILGIGFVAAIVAAVLVVNLTSGTPEAIREIVQVPTIETTKILVAEKRLNRGDVIAGSSFRWTDWPSSTASIPTKPRKVAV